MEGEGRSQGEERGRGGRRGGVGEGEEEAVLVKRWSGL